MIQFNHLAPNIDLGFLPAFLSESDPRPAREQFNENYAHGGGWQPMKGWAFNPSTASIKYPGDPYLYPIAYATLHKERIYVYEGAWVAIVQLDNSFEIARMD